ncbi:uncharacterized protein N0V96_001848 [Colletotrichum fioriniae]|uniref:uncharacterized protein n=1 Tax=Colletotrichum fioriniae TaxID=710243 RepID=UPI0032DBE597|nr:hypothetical protein N0V96_001848 [Colletotrichum fioriniae]
MDTDGTRKISFTSRGIVALVFSCITGILGVLTVAWYGLAKTPDGPSESGYRASAPGVAAGVDHAAENHPKEPIMVGAGPGGSGVSHA